VPNGPLIISNALQSTLNRTGPFTLNRTAPNGPGKRTIAYGL
jgi:hypothetical protein